MECALWISPVQGNTLCRLTWQTITRLLYGDGRMVGTRLIIISTNLFYQKKNFPPNRMINFVNKPVTLRNIDIE